MSFFNALQFRFPAPKLYRWPPNLMKKRFYILKERPKIEIQMTRDSVAAGDDCDAPHEKKVTIYSFLDPVILASHLSSGYLPIVNGVGHTWDCVLNGKIIANITTTGISPKVSEVAFFEFNQVHFVYHSATY